MSIDNKHQELLAKLISGTISDHEQWQLERASLDDPFLADALEGYRINESNKEGLSTLHKKLKSKTSFATSTTQPKTRILWPKRLSIAASLIVLMGASLWMFQSSEREMMTTAQNVEPARKAKHQAMPQQNTSDYHKDNLESEQQEDGISAGAREKAAEIKEYIQNSSIEKTRTSKEQNKTQKATKGTVQPPTTPPSESEIVFEDQEESSIEEEWQMDATKTEKATSPVPMKEQAVTEEIKKVVAIAETAQGGFSDAAYNSKKAKTKSKQRSTDLATTPPLDDALLANAAKIESLPLLSKGVVLNDQGNPMPGVQILDLEKNKIGVTDASGNFFLPEMNGYVITAFSGYDSLTVALSPNLSIQLQQSSKSLAQPQKRLVDLMDDTELRNYYINELNVLFSQHWPICSRANSPATVQNSGITRQLKNNTTIHVVISNNGKIFDITFYDELEEQCAEKISDLIFAAQAEELFIAGRPMSFTYRINF